MPGGARLVLIAIGLVTLVSWAVEPAAAACVVTGAGTQTSLQSSDSITCTGVGNTSVTTDNGASSVAISIGDGTTTTLVDPFGVGLDTTSNSFITVLDQATISADVQGINVTGGGGNLVTVLAGGTVEATTAGGIGIVIDNSDANTLNINGTVDSLTAGALGINVTPGSTGNSVTVGASGIVEAGDQLAILLEGGPGTTNTINNFGLITTGATVSISGTAGTEIIINAGKIEKTVALGDGGDSVLNQGEMDGLNLQDGDDMLELQAGYSFAGTVAGGTGTDILRFGGIGDSAFDLNTFGAGLQYREFETLQKTGPSRWTLSGSTTEAATMDMVAGWLVVNGSMANVDLTLHSGALGGSGTVGNVIVGSGGKVAPGNSIGTLTVNGDATFNAGSIYEVEVNAAGQSDLLAATGTATINGGTVHVVAFPDYLVGNPYAIITAGTLVTGTFDSATASLLFLTPTLSYDANNAFVTLTQTADLKDFAQTPNQIATAAAVDALGSGNAVFNAAVLQSSAVGAQAAFDALSGEGHATLKGVLMARSVTVRDAIFGRLDTALSAPAASDAVSGYAGAPMPSGESIGDGAIWGQLYGGLGNRAGDGNAAGASFADGGVLMGIDGAAGDWRLGVVVDAGMTSMSIGDRSTSARTLDYGIGIYGGTAWGSTGLAFGASYAGHAIDSTRDVAFTGFSETLRGSYGAATGQVFGELSHDLNLGELELTPHAQLAYVHHATGAFTETGGAAALSSRADVIDGTFTTLGLRGRRQFVVDGDGLATVSAGLGWRRGFVDQPTASNSFAGGGAFTVAGAPIAADLLTLEAGFEVDLATGLDVSLTYGGEIAATGQAHSLTARLGGAF